jgi:hypothetical protein
VVGVLVTPGSGVLQAGAEPERRHGLTVTASWVRATTCTHFSTRLDAHPEGTASTEQRLRMLNVSVMIESSYSGTGGDPGTTRRAWGS